MKTVTSVAGITNPYVKRILSNVIGKDPLKILASTPRSLERFALGLSDSQIRRSRTKGKWSIRQIIAHMCDIELVLGFRFRMALSQSGTPLQAMDQDKWADGLRYHKVEWRKKLRAFRAMREDHLSLLWSLSRQEWRRFGIHEERGKETLERMVQMLAGHDINHLKQIENIMSSFNERNKN